MTRFESTSDGIKSTSTKVSDVDGVLVEEVLSEPEQEKPTEQTDVVIEEVYEPDGKQLSNRFKTTQVIVECLRQKIR